jgi:hypothetical protein
MSKPVSQWGVAFTVSDGQFGTRYTSKFGSKQSVLKLLSIVDNVLKSCALDIQIQPQSIGSIVHNALPSTHPHSTPLPSSAPFFCKYPSSQTPAPKPQLPNPNSLIFPSLKLMLSPTQITAHRAHLLPDQSLTGNLISRSKNLLSRSSCLSILKDFHPSLWPQEGGHIIVFKRTALCY